MNSKEQNTADHLAANPTEGTTMPSDKLGKHMSASYKEAYGQKADPSMGTRVMAGKASRDETDSLHGGMKKESAGEAKTTPGATLKAIAKQCGHPPALQDNFAHSNSGAGPNATDPGDPSPKK